MSTSTALSYEIQVDGHLDDHWSSWLGDLALTREADGTTTLHGALADQAQLHGLLAGLRDIGTTLLSLRTLDSLELSQPVAVRPALPRPVSTSRLILRPAVAADADATWRYRRLETVGEWLTEVPQDLESYRATFAEPARLATTVVVELNEDHGGGLVGDFMLRVEDAWAQTEVASRAKGQQAELGWVLDPAYAGRGYASEAVRALVAICFEDLGVRRVVANCFLGNEASWRLMERLGMRREIHAVRESLHRSGRWLDVVGYALLADDVKPHRREPAEHVA